MTHHASASTASAGKSHTKRTRLIGLVGNPNSGKTTLFNRLTGLRHKVANYPGVTVERREGRMQGHDAIRIVDLPGCYSLTPRSPDELIARDVLMGWVDGAEPLDGVVVVVDASNLERNLFLASQVAELNLPTLIVCNMMDVVSGRGDAIDLELLSERLGAPVVGTVGSTGVGVDALRSAIDRMVDSTDRSGDEADWQPSESKGIGSLSWQPPHPTLSPKKGAGKAKADGGEGKEAAGGGAENRDKASKGARPAAWHQDERLRRTTSEVAQLVRDHRLIGPAATDALSLLLLSPGALNREDVAHIHLPEACRKTLAAIHERVHAETDGRASAFMHAIQARYAWLSRVVDEVQTRAPEKVTISDKIDRVATHKVWGMAVFAAMMGLIFLSIFSWAEPLMDGIETVMGLMADGVYALLGAGMLRDLLIDGVIAGMGNVVVFFPQICILFLFLALLEDSGYMARAAFVMDRVMAGAGLHGRSFIPLLSSYACAVPAIMATRTIENRRDRLTTILVAPLMSCSARLPIYILMISALFPGNPWLRAGIMFAMYALGTVTALLMARLFKRTILKGPAPSFIMELPPYRMPQIGTALRHMWDRSKLFLTEAGTIIVAISVVLWALAYFPRMETNGVANGAGSPVGRVSPAADEEDAAGVAAIPSPVTAPGEQLRQSYMGRFGRFIEPLIEPLGFDWKIGIGLTASFAAREVFVATMAVVYGVEDDADVESSPLREQIRNAAWPDGRKVYTPLVGISLMVFYVLACQCMSTLAIVRRETASWRWPIFMFAYMTALAYAGSFVVYQGGRLFGWG
ncbi:MAG: ferrous iron transport protein B [Phycisphaerales bacterium]|nr:ferrous iron transport protein B [Phycisphaerales bacterium]